MQNEEGFPYFSVCSVYVLSLNWPLNSEKKSEKRIFLDRRVKIKKKSGMLKFLEKRIRTKKIGNYYKQRKR